MIYLFYGKEKFLIDLEIKKIIKNITAMNVIRYDLENDTFKNLLDEIQTVSLFDEKKVVIVENLFKINSNEEKNLEEYLNNPNPDVILIIHETKPDERRKIIKKVFKSAKVKEFNSNNLEKIILNLFDDYKINHSEINLLIDRVGNDLELLNKEIEKIKIYKDTDKTITKEDIINLTHKNIDLDVFKLIDHIINKKINSAIELYNELLKNGSEPIAVITLLANQFRIMYQSKELIKKGYTQNDIAKIIDIHPYRVKLALENSRTYDNQLLLDYLSSLGNLDINIKTGKIDKYLGLELFILNLKRF